MSGLRKRAGVAKYDRTTGVATEQVVKATPGQLHSITVANANAAAQSVIVLDGAVTLIVLLLGIGESKTFDFGVAMVTDIRVNPSATDVDVLVVYS